MAFQGYARLELAREKKINGRTKREVVKRVEKKNTITGYVDGVLNEGNYGLLIPQNKLLPVRQFFEGCILTDNVNDATGNMIAHNSTITACAGNDPYTGTYMKRGSVSLESAVISSPNGYKGYRFVWDWTTDRGNGAISSVCLTRPAIAVSEFSSSEVPAVAMCEQLYATGYNSTNLLIGSLHIVDYEKEVAYKVRYNENTIYIDEYQLSCTGLHLLTRPLLYTSSETYKPEFVVTHPIAQSVANMNDNTSSISYNGTHIVIITWSGSNIKAYPISTSNWEMGTIVEKTFNSVTFANSHDVVYCPPYHKDTILLVGDDAWCMGTVGGVSKMLKIDLLGDTTDVKVEKTIPNGYIVNDTISRENGCCVLMPNGDFYKFCSVQADMRCLYYHNGEFSIGKFYQAAGGGVGNGAIISGINSNTYGTMLCNYADGRYNQNGEFDIITPHGFVSTIANLETSVRKTADLTMKLTYQITESSGS